MPAGPVAGGPSEPGQEVTSVLTAVSGRIGRGSATVGPLGDVITPVSIAVILAEAATDFVRKSQGRKQRDAKSRMAP